MTASHHRIAVILGALIAVGPLSIDMYLPAFPELVRDLGTDPNSVQLTLVSYFAGLAIGQACYGPLGDRLGRRVPLYAGLTIFTLASLACAMAPSIDMLIALRFAQALGGCAGMVISRAIVRDIFDERESARMLSMLMLVMGVAPILAPVLGAWLVTEFGWRAIFLTLAGFGALNLISIAATLGESLPPERRQRHGLLTVFRVYGALLRDPYFMRFALAGGLAIAGMFAYIAGSPYAFMEVYGVSPSHYGWIFGTNAAGLIFASQVNGWLVMRVDRARLLRAALTVSATAGLALAAAALIGRGGLVALLVPLFFFIACGGFVLPLSAALAMVPYGRNAGSASALIGVLQFTLGAASATLISGFHDASARPMAFMIAFCGCSALLILLALGRMPKRPPA